MEAGPFRWALQLGDVPAPHFIGLHREQFRLDIGRMHALATTFADLMMRGQQPIHGANRAVVAAFIQQRGEHRRRRHLGEALAVQKIQQHPLFGGRKRQGRTRAHREEAYPYLPLQPFPIQPGSTERERQASGNDADVRHQFVVRAHHGCSSESAVGRPSKVQSFF